MKLRLTISEPFFITGTEHGVGVYGFPWLYRLPGGDLILSIRLDRDQVDARRILLRSADGGATWTEDFHPRCHVEHPEYFALDERTAICIAWTKTYATRQEEHFVFPYWVSEDGGRSFGSTQVGRVHVPGATCVDPYARLLENPESYAQGFRKAARPPLPTYLEPMLQEATLKRAHGLEKVVVEPDGALLSVSSYTVAGDSRSSVVVFRSSDQGRNWELRTFAVRQSSSEFGEDAFCEPAIVRFPDGELFCVLRAGSYRPLCSIRSLDGGDTWSAPEPLPVEGVMPILVLMADGTLALATGRPDNVLCMSVDRGQTWPSRVTIQEWAGVENDRGEIVRRDHPRIPPDNPHLHSTGYNGLAEIEPGKLLFVHDTFSRDECQPDRWLQRHGHGRIFGRYVTVLK